MASNVDLLYPPNVWFSLGKTKESRNLCYHGTGSEEGAREEYAGNRKEQVCQSNVLEETDNKYNKGTTRDRMQFKQHRQQRDRLGGGGGVPPGGTPARMGQRRLSCSGSSRLLLWWLSGSADSCGLLRIAADYCGLLRIAPDYCG